MTVSTNMTRPLPQEGFGEYLVRAGVTPARMTPFGERMSGFDEMDPEGSIMKVYDEEAYASAYALKTFHERGAQEHPTQWTEVALATLTLMAKTEDPDWVFGYRQAYLAQA
ncbi:MAG: hypothetical protein PHN51_11990 [Candidatus Nanopelagicales bacterium]|nr:hypothetical protein [Candidatus Nanopelagicales bacterium]